MGAIVWEWLSLAVRFVHVITGIAWIGSSFYFIALDLGLRRREGLPDGVTGEAWQVHGGGFYHMQKYAVAPHFMPDELTWFKWESYFTFLSGFVLLCIVYYFGAELFLIDPSIADIPEWGAVLIGLAGLGSGWLAYDRLCRSPLGRHDTLLFVVLFVFLVVAFFLFCHVFSGRGAFIHCGALIATIMTANVFFVIIPNQKIVVADLKAGREPAAHLGKAAKQRSLHNNYLTLPVLFFMLSNHYPLAFATEWNWLIAILVLPTGALIRHFFNTMHRTGRKLWWPWAVVAVLVAAIVALSRFPGYGPQEAADARIDKDPELALMASMHFDEAQAIVMGHCSMCHAAEPLFEGVHTAPKGVLLDTPEEVARNWQRIDMQAVRSKAMPPPGVAVISPEERQTLAAWIGSRSAW
ncbi:urate hydroxylase PuuD [Afifella aestuarii]|uniref:urate hydroxylase PuuD n=1 Tax=Afifella aestuarii TaxID=1909496 RepID=UPI000FE4292C|nr:urate hydroxylase PuuD [Afifella aestuarii]